MGAPSLTSRAPNAMAPLPPPPPPPPSHPPQPPRPPQAAVPSPTTHTGRAAARTCSHCSFRSASPCSGTPPRRPRWALPPRVTSRRRSRRRSLALSKACCAPIATFSLSSSRHEVLPDPPFPHMSDPISPICQKLNSPKTGHSHKNPPHFPHTPGPISPTCQTSNSPKRGKSHTISPSGRAAWRRTAPRRRIRSGGARRGGGCRSGGAAAAPLATDRCGWGEARRPRIPRRAPAARRLGREPRRRRAPLLPRVPPPRLFRATRPVGSALRDAADPRSPARARAAQARGDERRRRAERTVGRRRRIVLRGEDKPPPL